MRNLYQSFILVLLFFNGYSQQDKNVFLKSSIGINLDGKGDLFGQGFSNMLSKELNRKSSINFQHEFYYGNNDFDGFFKHRTTNSFQVLYGRYLNSNKKINYELLFGIQYKRHRWKYSSTDGFAVVGTSRGNLIIRQGETKVFKEGSIGYTVAPNMNFKIDKIKSFVLTIQYQNDNQGYSVISFRGGIKVIL